MQALEPLGPEHGRRVLPLRLLPRRAALEASLHVTAALSLAALILYVPANIFPIMTMYLHGAYSESTVWDGISR